MPGPTLPAPPTEEAAARSLVAAPTVTTSGGVAVRDNEAGALANPDLVPAARRRYSVGKWVLLALVLLTGAGGYLWWHFSEKPLPTGIVVSNGRLEAIEIDISTKLAGRIDSVLAQEGDFVEAGQVVARMDTSVLRAQLREAIAQADRARMALGTANAVVEQRRSELELAQSVLHRSEQLVQGHFISTEKVDTDQAQVNVARAGLTAAFSQVAEAKAAVGATIATVDRINADIEDSVLRAPVAGRLQYRLAQPGEVLAAGGKVLSMLDLSDVYMTLFLPEESAGRLAIGAEARLIFDAAPQYVVPARVTFVAAEAQFTPKTVETSTERQKLVYRVKAQLAPELLRKYWSEVKAGVPGVGYVKVDPATPWPSALQIRMPDA